MSQFEYLIRFKNPSGQIWYGEVWIETAVRGSFVGSAVHVYRGKSSWDLDFNFLTGKR